MVTLFQDYENTATVTLDDGLGQVEETRNVVHVEHKGGWLIMKTIMSVRAVALGAWAFYTIQITGGDK